MARHIQEEDLQKIEDVVRGYTEGVMAQRVAAALTPAPPHRTLQYRLKFLVDDKLLFMKGAGRWARYLVPRIEEAAGAAAGRPEALAEGETLLPLSKPGAEIAAYVRKPPAARWPSDIPAPFWIRTGPMKPSISPLISAHLNRVGTPKLARAPADTYA